MNLPDNKQNNAGYPATSGVPPVFPLPYNHLQYIQTPQPNYVPNLYVSPQPLYASSMPTLLPNLQFCKLCQTLPSLSAENTNCFYCDRYNSVMECLKQLLFSNQININRITELENKIEKMEECKIPKFPKLPAITPIEKAFLTPRNDSKIYEGENFSELVKKIKEEYADLNDLDFDKEFFISKSITHKNHKITYFRKMDKKNVIQYHLFTITTN